METPAIALKVPTETDFVDWAAAKRVGVPKNVRVMKFHRVGPTVERRAIVAFAPVPELSTPEKTVLRYGVSYYTKDFLSSGTSCGPRSAWDVQGRKVTVFLRPTRSQDLCEWNRLQAGVRNTAVERLWKKPKTLELPFPLIFPHSKASNSKEQAELLRKTLKAEIVDNRVPKTNDPVA